MAGPELSVVCRNCGSEVSPYVTECPYCGTRLRKRAPRIDREDGEMKVREGRREKKLRRDAQRREQSGERRSRATRGRPRIEELSTKPIATVSLIGIPAVIYVLIQASVLDAFDFAIVGSPSSQPWHCLSAPFGVANTGYLFVTGVAIAIFGPALERRLGSVATGVLGLACGVLGMLAAVGLDSVLGDDFPIAAGPNAIALGFLAAYMAIREPERRADPEDSYDLIAVGVVAVVLLALPIVEPFADPWAGVAGAAVGLACGYSATMGRKGSAA